MKKAWLALMAIAIALAISCHYAKQCSGQLSKKPGKMKNPDRGSSPLIRNVFMLFTNQ
ncbi:MAG TPA: hypothetical protein VHK91_01635 [Flavisolibacter sp.]|jgi:hypothetical protein|nr:hypothetical protein [Flavisolibacter sp.]